MTTCYKTRFGMALMNLYRNAPMLTDISLTVDFTKGVVLADEVDSTRSSDATSHLGTTPPVERSKSSAQSSTAKTKSSNSKSSTTKTKSSKSTKKKELNSGKKKKKPKSTTDEEVDWNEPLEGIVLPDGDYSTFDEIELVARRIQAAARRKNISVEKEIAYRNNQLKKTAPSTSSNSLRRRMDILVTPVRSTSQCDGQSSLYEMYYPVDPSSKKKKKSKKKKEKSSRSSRAKTDKKKKEKRPVEATESLSEDVKLCNSQGDTATSFDVDSSSIRTDEIFP